MTPICTEFAEIGMSIHHSGVSPLIRSRSTVDRVLIQTISDQPLVMNRPGFNVSPDVSHFSAAPSLGHPAVPILSCIPDTQKLLTGLLLCQGCL